MNTTDQTNEDSGGDRPPDHREPRDTDRVTERTEAPDEPGETGFDEDAPGNYVDDSDSPDIPEPNEPA